ncbi:hypothetical protein, partial [Klebsiella pneumoniae]
MFALFASMLIGLGMVWKSISKPYSARTVISRIPSCLAVKCRTPEGI